LDTNVSEDGARIDFEKSYHLSSDNKTRQGKKFQQPHEAQYPDPTSANGKT